MIRFHLEVQTNARSAQTELLSSGQTAPRADVALVLLLEEMGRSSRGLAIYLLLYFPTI